MQQILNSVFVFPVFFLILIYGIILLHLSGLRVQKRFIREEIERDFENLLLEKDNDIQSLEARNNEKIRLLEDAERAILRAKQRQLETEHDLMEIMPFKVSADELALELWDMKRVWIDNNSLENECREVLAKNMWVFWPDYSLTNRPIMERKIGNAISDLYNGETDHIQSTSYDIKTNEDSRVDLCGWADVSANFQPSYSTDRREVLLLIELKRASATIDSKAIEQSFAYATSLMTQAASELWGEPIDCLAIGGAVSSDTNDIHLRFGAMTHSAIRIIPLTYKTLFARALKIAEKYIDTSFLFEDSIDNRADYFQRVDDLLDNVSASIH